MVGALAGLEKHVLKPQGESDLDLLVKRTAVISDHTGHGVPQIELDLLANFVARLQPLNVLSPLVFYDDALK
jgi:hypothetical protein